MVDADLDQVLQLLQASLGWVPDDVFRRYFRWKHLENPFGRSPAWVAEREGAVVGLRTFLRWRFTVGGETVEAIRAVDTATHPDVQGRGVFTRLTLDALDDLQAAGFAWIFNTPNDRSRPGYLKMGWSVLGRPPLVAAPRLAATTRLRTARVPAERWSVSTDVGDPADELLADDALIEGWLEEAGRDGRLVTSRTPAQLRWRYGFEALRYRAVPLHRDVARGAAIFRLRRRGRALEATVCDVLGPRPDVPRALRQVARATKADVAVGIGRRAIRQGILPLPRQGPTITVRTLGDSAPPPIERWDLRLGDLELL